MNKIKLIECIKLLEKITNKKVVFKEAMEGNEDEYNSFKNSQDEYGEDLNDEQDESNFKDDPESLACHISEDYCGAIIPTSPRYIYGPDEDGTYNLVFLLGFNTNEIEDPEEKEIEINEAIGGNSDNDNPGQGYQKIKIEYKGIKNNQYIYKIDVKGGYDI